jgi:cytochrome c-type protein NapB
MRGQDRPDLRLSELLRPLLAAAFGGLLLFVAGAIYAQTATGPQIVPRITGAAAPMGENPAPPFARPVTDDKRVTRNYPEQPPVIPHAIENYQLTLKTNRCLECHRRQYTEASGAPMISVTHFMDRNGQVLGDVTPRRYFCTECHVQQTDARALVPNTFTDMSATEGSKK